MTYVAKPSGYSFFPKELMPIPVSWVATTANLVHSKVHTSGGHFAVSFLRFCLTSGGSDCIVVISVLMILECVMQAMEKPQELLEDIEEYAKKAWELKA